MDMMHVGLELSRSTELSAGVLDFSSGTVPGGVAGGAGS